MLGPTAERVILRPTAEGSGFFASLRMTVELRMTLRAGQNDRPTVERGWIRPCPAGRQEIPEQVGDDVEVGRG